MVKSKLCIVHIVEVCQGGVSTYLENLIDWQAQSPVFGEVHLIACKNGITQELQSSQANIHYYESSRNPLFFYRAARGIAQALDQIKPDIVHIHSTFPGLYVRLFIHNQIRKTRTIYCAHGWAFTQDIGWLKKKLYASVERFLAKRTDTLIHISWSEYFAALKYGIRAKNEEVAYLGVRDVKRSDQPAVEVDPTKINIGFVGRYDRQKGLDILLSQIRENDFSGMAFYTIGGTVRNTFSLDTHLDDVQNLGWIESARIDDYMAQFDAIIVPSRWEGMGLVAIEAMRNSVSILVSNRGALPEFVIPGFNGYVFDLDCPNQIANLLRQQSKRELKAMGANGRFVYEKHFNHASTQQRFEKIYTTLMEQEK